VESWVWDDGDERCVAFEVRCFALFDYFFFALSIDSYTSFVIKLFPTSFVKKYFNLKVY
jgi:hypothetical protein